MPVQTQIQVRRSIAATWTSTNPTLASGEMGFETDTGKFKIGNGSSTWNGLAYANDGDITAVTAGVGISGGGTSGNVTVTNSMATAIDAKGDLVIGTGADTFSRLAVGTNNQILVADSATTTGTKWADNVSPYNISITIPSGTKADTLSATYDFPAGVYTVQASGSTSTITYGANSFTPAGAANATIQNLASPGSSISATTTKTWTGTVALNVASVTSQSVFSYENGFFTISGNSGSTSQGSWSTTGTTFTAFSGLNLYNASPAGPTKIVRDAADTQWVAIGWNSTPINIVATSLNGTTWTSRATVNTSLRNLISSPSVYVLFGGSGLLSTSTDAITWTTRTSGFGAASINALVFANSLYVGGASDGSIRTSTDAITWTARTSNFGANSILNIVYTNNIYIAAGVNGKMVTSTDAITWTTRDTGTITEAIYGIAWDGTNYGFGVTGSIRTSTDLITWTSRTGTNFGRQLAGNGISGAGNVTVTFPGGGNGAYTTVGLTGDTKSATFARIDLGKTVTLS